MCRNKNALNRRAKFTASTFWPSGGLKENAKVVSKTSTRPTAPLLFAFSLFYLLLPAKSCCCSVAAAQLLAFLSCATNQGATEEGISSFSRQDSSLAIVPCFSYFLHLLVFCCTSWFLLLHIFLRLSPRNHSADTQRSTDKGRNPSLR